MDTSNIKLPDNIEEKVYRQSSNSISTVSPTSTIVTTQSNSLFITCSIDSPTNIDYISYSLKKDMYNAILWTPFLLLNCGTNTIVPTDEPSASVYSTSMSTISQKRKKLLLSVLYFNFFVMTVLTLSLPSYIIYNAIIDIKTNNYAWVQLNGNLLIIIAAGILFYIYLITGFYDSYKPSRFWWRNIQFGEWKFKYITNNDTHISIEQLAAPKSNVIIRAIIVFGVQIITKIILFIAGLLLIFDTKDIIDVIKDCLALIFIMENDEIIFNYIYEKNSDFKKIWKDIILISKIKKCDQNHNIKYIWKHLRSSMLVPICIILMGIGMMILLKKIITIISED